MERLYFVCPTTGREIDAGIETELETLLRIRLNKVRMLCPLCGWRHEWSVNEAQLETAA
jgi:hypothetical protein